MADTLSTSPTVHSSLSRQVSPAGSDDSSVCELSFDYLKDSDGQVHRVSKRRQGSLSIPTSPIPPITFHGDSPHSGPPSYDSNAFVNGGVGTSGTPRRSSLSRSESAPGPTEWDQQLIQQREWKRTVSTPATQQLMNGGVSRPKSVLGLLDSNLHNKENEHVGLCQSFYSILFCLIYSDMGYSYTDTS